MARAAAPIAAVRAAAYTIPTDRPEADGTFAWSATTLVLAEVDAGGVTGLGYTYTQASAAGLIRGALVDVILGLDAFDALACARAMQASVRNIGRDGVAATAISALDAAIWDAKAKALDLPLCRLLGQLREEVPVYGSGGFTTWSDDAVAAQLESWVAGDGCRAVKMKIGTEPDRDPDRMAAVRRAIGTAELFIDANGAFVPRQALAMAERAACHGVTWFEEPVSGDDLAGLRFVRERAPVGMDVTAGEYGYDLDYYRIVLASGALDVVQADATRCGGVTGFLSAATLCDAHHVPLSAHCAPAVNLHAACAAPRLRHVEWFHDHARIEAMLLDGAPVVRGGTIRPDLARPGHGLDFKARDAERYAVG